MLLDARMINSSRLTKMVSENLGLTNEQSDAFYSELSQISAPAIRSAIEALCKKGTEKNVSFMDLYVGCHVKWHNKDDKKINAVVTRMPKANNPNRYWCMAEAEDGTHILIDNSNIDQFELIKYL